MKYVARVLNSVAYKYVIQVGNQKLTNKEMAKISIPLPSPEAQREITAEIEEYKKAIDEHKQSILDCEGKIKRVIDGV